MLGTTSTGIPSDDDLVYLMTHGIPGSAMPDFPNLSDEQKRAVGHHVRRLAYAALYAKRFQLLARDEDPDPKEVHEWTGKQLAVGDPLPLPANLKKPGPSALAHGKEIFMKNCAACHGPQGKGDGKDVGGLKLDNGRPTRLRDLAAGVYKGGASRTGCSPGSRSACRARRCRTCGYCRRRTGPTWYTSSGPCPASNRVRRAHRR